MEAFKRGMALQEFDKVSNRLSVSRCIGIPHDGAECKVSKVGPVRGVKPCSIGRLCGVSYDPEGLEVGTTESKHVP